MAIIQQSFFQSTKSFLIFLKARANTHSGLIISLKNFLSIRPDYSKSFNEKMFCLY